MPLFTSAGTDEGLGEFFKSMQVLLPAFLKFGFENFYIMIGTTV